MDGTAPFTETPSHKINPDAKSKASGGLLSWFWGSKPTPEVPTMPSPQVSPAAKDPQSLMHKVMTDSTNRSSEDIIRCWEKMRLKDDVVLHVGPKNHVQTYYTEFKRHIIPTSSLTIAEIDTQIIMASSYGARSWNGSLWFSAASADTLGVQSVQMCQDGVSQFYPFQGMDQTVIPLLIGSHSNNGDNGYLCIYEGDALCGVSTWTMDSLIPERVFFQNGFECVFFFGNAQFLALNHSSQSLECWNAASRALEFALEGWKKPSEYYMEFCKFNAEKHLLLADDGMHLYAFDIANKKLAYELELPSDGSAGMFAIDLIADEWFYCRKISSSQVRVFNIENGSLQYAFDAGGAKDFYDDDDFPMCIFADSIAALKSDDRRTIQIRDAKTGEITKSFGPTSQDITGIYVSENRLIAACQATTESRIKGFHDQIVIWELATGRQLKLIIASDGYDMSVQDISSGIMTAYLAKFDAQPRRQKNALLQRSGKEKKPLIAHSKPNQYEWSWPYPLQIDDSTLKFDVWHLESCMPMGSIEEQFTPTNGLSLFASYKAGQLVLDSDQSVLVQNFSLLPE
jgi:hypothetical protein